MHEQHDDNQLHLPDELVRELKARDVSQPFVPAAVDEAVLARAREQFAAGRADNEHDRGEDSGSSGERLSGPGAGGKKKAVFWGRTALAGVGSVAAALLLVAMLATEPTSLPGTHEADWAQPDMNQMLAYGEAPAAPPATVQRKLEESNSSTSTVARRFASQATGFAVDEDAADTGALADSSMPANGAPRFDAKDMELADGTTMGRDIAMDDAFDRSDKEKLVSSGPLAGTTMAKAERAREVDAAVAMPQGAQPPAESEAAIARDATPALDDIDRSGRVDILDVYLLARQREAGDTAITQAAIDAIATQVVRLARSEGGSL